MAPSESIQEILNEIVGVTDDLSQDETDQQMNQQALEITKEGITLGKQTARTFCRMADTLDFLWKTSQKAQLGGTSAAILGGILAIAGGIATVFSAGAATPLMIAGIGFGFGGAGTKIVASFIEAAMNSNEIKKADEEWQKTAKVLKQMENRLQELVKKSGKPLPGADRFLDFGRRLASIGVVSFCTLIKELQAAGQAGAQATTKAATKAGALEVSKAGLNTVDDAAGVFAKVSTKALGKVVIGVSAVFLVLDVIELGCTIKDLVKEKGAGAARVLRAKAKELDKVCSVY